MKYLKQYPIALLFTAALPLAAVASDLRDGYHVLAVEGGEGSLRIASGFARFVMDGEYCSGSVEGAISLRPEGGTIFTDQSLGEVCTIAILTDADGGAERIEEVGMGCNAYHGAGCSFNGTVWSLEVPHSASAIDAGFNSLAQRDRIKVQEVLRDRGDYWDDIDGVTGPGTRRAIVDAGRTELSSTPDLDLESEENVRAWLLSLIDTGTDEPT